MFSALPPIRAETLPFKSYTTSDGLAHDRVNKIVRDSRGFLWFCTSEGLSRFDGYEFKNYTQDDGLPHRAVFDFLETKSGEFWVATYDGVVLFNPAGISKRDETSENNHTLPMFRAFRPADLKTEPTTWAISDLLEDRDGKIWIASSHGLYRLIKQGDWQLQRFDVPAAAALRVEDFTVLLQDFTGAVWAATGLEVYRILPDNAGIQTISKKLKAIAMLEDKNHQVWVGGTVGTAGDKESLGLHLFETSGVTPREIRVFLKNDGLSDDYWMNALIETSDGRIFVGVGNSLSEFTPQADANQPQFRTLSNEGVVALAEDTSGNLWFSTNSSGVRRLAHGGFVNFDQSDSLANKSIASVFLSSDHEIYVLAGGKVNRFNGKGFDSVIPREMIAGSWGTGQISFRDHTGAWWFSGTSGLQRYPAVAKFEDLATTAPLKTYTTKDGLYSNEIFRLFEDSRGDIWISTIGKITNTVMRWERATGIFHGLTTDDNFPTRNGATTFAEDPASNIWIGFYGGGLLRYRAGKTDLFTSADNLPSGYIHNIFTDSAGRIWVATSSGGVVRVDDPTSEEKPRLVNLTTRDGLSSNQATCVTEDDFGRIYISTGRGVNRLDLQSGRIKVFTKTDGLPENIVTLCKKDADGALWFGTYNGLARYLPIAEEQSAAPPIFLSGLRVNGESIKKLSELGETEVKNLDLASDQRQIQIDFFALGFGTGEALRYQYKLDNAEWSEPVAQRTVNLNLSPGKYQFLVRAVNANGVISENPASISFSISRPVWQRWWFLLLLTLAVVGLIYLIYSYRLKRLLELEKVRTRIATDLHDDIGASLSKIAILSEVVHQRVAPVAANDAEVSEPLEAIAETSRELVDSMSDIVWAINPERDHLADLIQRMRSIAGELTEFADIGMRVKLAGIEEDADLPLGADLRREIYLIFKETINNLVKHSGCEMAEVEFRIENDNLIVSVKDDGKGVTPAANGNGANGNGATRGGNGLPNMKRRAASLNGSYEITSEIGKGTTVMLRVPLQTGLRGFNLRNFYRRN